MTIIKDSAPKWKRHETYDFFVDKEIAAKIKSAQHKEKLTNDETADGAEVSKSLLSQAKRGRIKFYWRDDILRLLNFFDLGAEYNFPMCEKIKCSRCGDSSYIYFVYEVDKKIKNLRSLF